MIKIEEINSKLNCLPYGDAVLAEEYLKDRNFETLLELVESAIVRISHRQEQEDPDPKYLKLDLDNIRLLSFMINNYIALTEI